MKEVEKLDLGIDENETTPFSPNIQWGGKMLGILIVALVFCYGCFWLFSYIVISFISLEDEKKYFGNIIIDESMEKLDFSEFVHQLPASKNYDVYILEDEMENAFAAIGAQIMVTRGLLNNVKTEEELLFIIGHEISHLENRDALRSFLIHAPITVSMGFLGIDAGGIPLTQLTNIFIQKQSRDTEREADVGGVALLKELGLNSECAVGFFERNGNENEKYLELFSSHPVSEERTEFIANSAGEFAGQECTEI